MYSKISNTLIGLLIAWASATHAQPVQQWQDRNGEWHFGDPRAAPTQGSRDVKIQRPISVVKNEHPLPRYTPNTTMQRPPSRPSSNRTHTPQPQKRTKADCESLRESLTLHPARQQQHRQRQQQYERDCVIGVYYADSQQ